MTSLRLLVLQAMVLRPDAAMPTWARVIGKLPSGQTIGTWGVRKCLHEMEADGLVRQEWDAEKRRPQWLLPTYPTYLPSSLRSSNTGEQP